MLGLGLLIVGLARPRPSPCSTRTCDGYVTKAEVIAVLTRKTGQGTEISDEAARATWQRWQAEFDPNNDGKVSVEELVGPPKMGGSGIAR